MYIKTTIEGFFKENTTFQDIAPSAYIRMKPRKYSDEVCMKHMRSFKGKDGTDFLIVKDIQQDVFKVYNESHLKESKGIQYIAFAFFDVSYTKKKFSGTSFAISINVEQEYRRLGIATAIIDFAEEYYQLPYIPAEVLTTDMEEFIKNRK